MRVGGKRLFVGVFGGATLAAALHAVAFGDAGGGFEFGIAATHLSEQGLHFAVAVEFAEEGSVVGVAKQVFGMAVNQFLVHLVAGGDVAFFFVKDGEDVPGFRRVRVDFDGALQFGFGEVVAPHLQVLRAQLDVVFVGLAVVGFFLDDGGDVVVIVVAAAKAECATAAQKHRRGGAEQGKFFHFHTVSTSFLVCLRSRIRRSLNCPTSCPQAASMSSPRVLRMVAT